MEKPNVSPALRPSSSVFHVWRLFRMALLAGMLALVRPSGAAQLYLQMDIHQSGSAADGNLGYYAFAFLNTTNTPITYDQVYSWNTNYQFQGGVGPGSSTYGLGFGSLSDMLYAFTNGPWLLVVNAGDPSQQTYHFSMSAADFSTNAFAQVHVLWPTNGAVNVTNNPDFIWAGATNYPEVDVVESGVNQNLYVNAALDPDATNWMPGIILNQGVFSIDVTYYNSNAPTVLSITTPTNSLGQTPPGWVTTNRLFADESVQFTVGTPDGSGTPHLLVAHYPFDAAGGFVLDAAVDTSGNGFDMTFTNDFGAEGGGLMTSNAIAGIGALQLNNGDGNSGGDLGWTNPTPPGLLSALAGSFSISCWIQTTQGNFGWNQAPAYYGAGIVSADVESQANDSVPMALTGSTIGFNTGGDSDDTVNSITSVNDGNYHHVVVTRNLITGQKIIYIDGQLDSFSSGTTNLLNDPQKLTIGALADAGDPDPYDGSEYNGYNGLLDDLQIYSGVLSSNEVAFLYNNPGSTAANSGASSGGHTNIAHYAFDNSGYLGLDSSINANNMDGYSYWGAIQEFTTDAEAGGGAVQFYGTSALTPNGSALAAWDAVLAGSFTISAWVNTTNSLGSSSDDAVNGATLFWAYDDHNNINDTIPISLTGGVEAFSTRDHLGNTTTLHSTTTVNDGLYHLITVTRDQSSGEMAVYVDGNPEGAAFGTTEPLNGNNYFLSIGGTTISSYTGLADDVQIYSGVLNPGEVAYLYANPGQVVADTQGMGADFNSALGTTNLTWNTYGDSDWFVESTNTYSGSASAAQSGSVTGSQSSTLALTITGPGELSFYWSSIANDPNQGFDYVFALDGGYEDDIYQDTSWRQDGPFLIGAGQHTLTWTVYAYGDTDPTQAGFLDQVSFVPATPPEITLNPFNQTNYPGYQVALLAGDNTNSGATWQWYEVGNPSPISNATNALFIPANSGAPGVAGGYYAIASNSFGSAMTTTAAVSFAASALPPNWSAAFKSPFDNGNLPNSDFYLGCYLDATGSLYAVGSFLGTNTIGAQSYISPNGTYSADIVKESTSGNPIWAVAVTNNGHGNSQAYSAVAAPGNGTYIAGNFNGTNWLGTNQLVDLSQGVDSIFLARLDANGNPLWVRAISGTNFCFTEYYELVSDPAGNVTLSGLFWGSTAFPGTNAATSTNLYADFQKGGLAQYDANGALRWAEITTNWMITMTYSGGRIYGVMDNNAINPYFANLQNITSLAKSLVAVNESTGQPLWMQGIGEPFGQPNPLNINAVGPLVTALGANVFVCGTSVGSNAAFGPYNVSWTGSGRQYIGRCDTNGAPQSLASFGSTTTQPWSILADPSGGVYLSGDFDTYSLFGNDIIAAPHIESIGQGYFTDGFLAKFDVNGNPLWARIAEPQSGLCNLRGLTLAPNGVWAAGIIKSPTTFSPITVDGTATCVGSPCSPTYYESGVLAEITESASASPVTLFNPQEIGANFQFSFLSQAGFTNSVQFRTNLTSGAWQTYSNLSGDGSLKTIPMPLSVFSPANQGFIRVSTQ